MNTKDFYIKKFGMLKEELVVHRQKVGEKYKQFLEGKVIVKVIFNDFLGFEKFITEDGYTIELGGGADQANIRAILDSNGKRVNIKWHQECRDNER